MSRSVFWIYVEYFWLRVREIFDRKMSRKLMWKLYWETTKRIEDIKLNKEQSKNKDKEVKMGLQLCSQIRDHLINLEGGKKR